jgi:undecaprenyl-diphosphatase
MSVSDATAQHPRGWLSAVRTNAARAYATLVRAPNVLTQPRWRSPQLIAVGALTTMVVLALLMVFVDRLAPEATRNQSLAVVLVFEEITNFGRSGWFLIPTGIALIAIAMLAPLLTHGSQQVLASLAVRIGFVFTAVAVPSLFTTIIKRVIARARPYVGDPIDPFLFRPGVWRSEYASLPSGHTTTAFALLVAVGVLWPRLQPVMWIYALAIAVSRVVLHAHHPSDVVAGAAVGAIGALLVRDWFAARRLGFTISPDGRVHARPGPSFARIKRVAGRLLAP